jgi:transcriptional regulator with XRE-family HTH domain
MMLGSFLRAVDVPYSGDLETGIHLSKEKIIKALQEIRKIHFRHRALYRGLTSTTFGNRLKRLVDDRCGGDYPQFADDLGINLTYLLNLMNEPFAVSNPSGRLLIRIAARLGERIAYLLGESEEIDPIWVESNAAWHRWIEGGTGVDAGLAFQLRKKWRNDYHLMQREQQLSTASHRTTAKLMRVEDWDREYRKVSRGKSGSSGIQGSLGV